jgi:excisionase family DNA binding protein
VIRCGAFPLSNKTWGKFLLCCVCCLSTHALMSNASPLEYLRPAEAAKRLGISRNTLNRYLAKGLIRCSRPSLRCTLISTAELARFYSATAQPVPVSMVRAA